MTPNIDNLPYSYTENSRAGSPALMGFSIVLTAALAVVNYFEFFAISTWVILLPLILLALRSFIYSLLTNAFHEALRKAEADSHLDDLLTAAAEAQDIQDRKSMLTPGFFNEKFFPQGPA